MYFISFSYDINCIRPAFQFIGAFLDLHSFLRKGRSSVGVDCKAASILIELPYQPGASPSYTRVNGGWMNKGKTSAEFCNSSKAHESPLRCPLVRVHLQPQAWTVESIWGAAPIISVETLRYDKSYLWFIDLVKSVYSTIPLFRNSPRIHLRAF